MEKTTIKPCVINGNTLIISGERSSIIDSEFKCNACIKTVIIEDGIRWIGNNTFSQCKNLVNISFPNTLIGIGKHAFEGCAVEDISLPASLLFIGEGAFRDCFYLKQISFSGMPLQIESTAFKGCRSLANSKGYIIVAGQIYDYIGNDEILDIPWQFGIGAYAFAGNEAIREVMISGEREIGNYAFCNCTNLKRVVIIHPDTTIGKGCFAGCKNLNQVMLPSNLKVVREHTFAECTSIEKISIPESVNCIEAEAFFKCTSLRVVIFPNSNAEIKEHAFGLCSALMDSHSLCIIVNGKLLESSRACEEVNVPENVSEISEASFFGDTTIRRITIPYSTLKICKFAFARCTNLEEVIIQNPHIKIDSNAFISCKNLHHFKLSWLAEFDPTEFPGSETLRDITE